MKGSHNSLTYGRPCRWWGWLLLPLWRCQRRGLSAQIARGCVSFDIRVIRRRGMPSFWGHGRMWGSAHGIVDVEVNPVSAIGEICAREDRPYIRVILERGDDEQAERDFVDLCGRLESRYPQVRFYGGIRKRGWVQLYRFAGDDGGLERTLVQHVGSMQSRYGKLLPGLWAWLHRRDIPAEAGSEDLPIVALDMI